MGRRIWKITAAVLALSVLVRCGGRRDEFIAGRVADRCDGEWPVCDQIAGCLIGNQSYVEGRFPGQNRVAVQLFEPSTVKAWFFLQETSAAGTETVVSFFEDRCRARIRETLSGRAFVGEAEQLGYVLREAELSGIGDHLLTFQSDSKTSYLFKVEVIPTRLSGQ
jgi:hypothetical protein